MNEFIVAAVAVAFTGLLFFIVYDHIKHREPNEVVTTPPPSLDDLAVSKRSTKTSLYRCGHYASSKYTVSIFSVLIERSCKENKLCPHCFIEQCKHDVIRCCVCGRAILPGQMVVLYSSKGFENIPSYA
ncbi:MAG: hypothetical protein KGJ35_03740, partial [Patescibacteria group bacterium]|nr:hypothetical protein [Patescibacteria group bacterium]